MGRPADLGSDISTALSARAPKPVLDLIAKAAADESADGRKALLRIAFEAPSVRLRRAAAQALAGRKDRDDSIDSILFRWQNAATVSCEIDSSSRRILLPIRKRFIPSFAKA